METIIQNNVSPLFQIVSNFFDNLLAPKKVTEFPRKCHIAGHVVVDGKKCTIVYDFDKHAEYLVHPKV